MCLCVFVLHLGLGWRGSKLTCDNFFFSFLLLFLTQRNVSRASKEWIKCFFLLLPSFLSLSFPFFFSFCFHFCMTPRSKKFKVAKKKKLRSCSVNSLKNLKAMMAKPKFVHYPSPFLATSWLRAVVQPGVESLEIFLFSCWRTKAK